MKIRMATLKCFAGLAAITLATSAVAQTPPAAPQLPSVLPGKGLNEHPFLYCGEYAFDQDQQTVWLVRDGKVVWRYDIKFNVMRGGKKDIQELGDCTLLSNGNIMFTTRFGAL